MEKNLFDGAKFGDKFRTIDGRMAIYHYHEDLYSGDHFLIAEDGDELILCDDGTCAKDIPEEYNNRDIVVSRWEENINEEELDKMAKEYSRNNLAIFKLENDVEMTDYSSSLSAFKAGYRKAKMEK